MITISDEELPPLPKPHLRRATFPDLFTAKQMREAQRATLKMASIPKEPPGELTAKRLQELLARNSCLVDDEVAKLAYHILVRLMEPKVKQRRGQ